MKTEDKKLLEMAAKAVGFTLHWKKQADHEYCWRDESPLWDSEKEASMWNPRDDDALSFRLAAMLKMNINHVDAAYPYIEVSISPSMLVNKYMAYYDGDVCKATRDAIFDLAVKIGVAVCIAEQRAMP